jgi:hypothetical protein
VITASLVYGLAMRDAMVPRFPAGEMPPVPAPRGGFTGRGNAAPLPESRIFQIEKGKTLTVAAPGLIPAAPRADESGASRTAAIDGAPAHGKATLSADGGFTYVPEKTFSGTDTFTFHVTSGTTTLPGTVTILVR